VAITADRSVRGKEAQRKFKYKNLRIEAQRMWDMKCLIIQVITGVTIIVTKGLKKNFEALIGQHSIRSLQKTAILGT